MIYLKLVATAVLWGGTFIAGRIVSHEVEPFSAAFLRFLVASLFLLAFTLKAYGRVPALSSKQILPVFLLGLTGVFAYNVLFFSGLKTVTASRASLIVACNPVFIALFSHFLFGERLGCWKATGIILSVAGAAVVISRGNPATILHGGLGWGELFIFGCVVSWVAYSLIGKVAMRDLSPLVSVTYACVIGTACLSVPALLRGITGAIAHYSLPVWTGLFYLGFFGSALGFFWYYEGIKAIGPSRAGIFINFVPVSSISLAYLILDEALSASLVIGASMVITGVLLMNRPQATQRASLQSTAPGGRSG